MSALLNRPESAETLSDSDLQQATENFWQMDNRKVFELEDAETDFHQSEMRLNLQQNPFFKDLPHFAALKELQQATPEETADLTNLSLQQTAYYESLYEKPGLSDLPDQRFGTSITAKMGWIPTAEQVAKIKRLTAAPGIDATESDWETVGKTIDRGGSVVADINDVPIVCGAGKEASVSNDIYLLSASQGNGLLSKGEGGDNSSDFKKTQGEAIDRHAQGDSDHTGERSEEKGTKIHTPKATQELEGGVENTEHEGPQVIVKTGPERDQNVVGRTRQAVLAASSVPLAPPSKKKEGMTERGKGAVKMGNYTDAERRLITGLSQDADIRKLLPKMENFKEDAEGIRNLLAMRFEPDTQNILAMDDDEARPREFFHAVKAALEANPELKKIAEQNFKRQLLSMKPENKEEEEKYAPYLDRLDMMKSLSDPNQMLDLVDAHLHGKLPYVAYEAQFPELRARNANEPGLRKAN